MKFQDMIMFQPFQIDDKKYVRMNSGQKKNAAVIDEDGHSGEFITIKLNQDVVLCKERI